MLDIDYTVKVRLPIIIFTVVFTYGTVFWVSTPTRKGVGYEPQQPIAYSHKLHAGDMQIDCRYCHVGADKSRHAVVPSVDTCMNCHTTVKSVGRDPEVFTYLINKEGVSDKKSDLNAQLVRLIPANGSPKRVVASVVNAQKKFNDTTTLLNNVTKASTAKAIADGLDEIITKKDLRASFLQIYGKNEYKDSEITDLQKKTELSEKESQKLCRFVMDELFDIDSYNSKELKKLRNYYETGTPLVWKRIYHLPEYAYFNHSVHVNKGIDCTFCHGNVAELDSMKKMKPITMGRCIDCHRGDYQEYHETITDKERVPGPENCGACHR